MATIKTDKKSSLIIKVETGTSVSGSAIVSNRTFSHVSPDAGDTPLLAFATALGALQQYPVNTVLRRDEATLVNE